MLKKFNKIETSSNKTVYIVHGLNQKISIWNHWFDSLISDCSCDIYATQLKGHKSSESLNDYSYRLWYEQVEKDLNEIIRKTKDQKLYILAYSLGGLLVLDVLIKNKINPDKLILIAPAISPHMLIMNLPDISDKALKKIYIPSLSPRISRVHNSISLYTYMQIAKAVKATVPKLNNLNTKKLAVYMDPKDELLNANKTYVTLQQSNLKFDWNLVNSIGSGLGKHHLLPAKNYLNSNDYKNILSEFC